MRIKNIGVVGFGLIGASFGMAVKKYTSHNVFAFDNDEKVIEYAEKNRICDGAYKINDEILRSCDIIFVALYPKLTVEFILNNLNSFKENAIICDLCGVKEFIVNSISGKKDLKIRFVGAHPMAGKEVNGIENAEADLFSNASLILTPTMNTDKDAIKEITALGKKIGFKNVIETTASNHDRIISFTSQLPHIASVAYVMQDCFKKCDNYYAGSFKDMARVAKINPYLWSELFKINKNKIVDQIDEYIKALSDIKDAILKDDDELFNILKKSRELKEWQDENYTD